MSEFSYTNELLEQFFSTFYKLEKQFFQLTYPNLTITEFHTLEAISESELTMFQLASRLKITMGTATTAVNKLLKKEFIDRKKDNFDKRKVLVSLTQIGLNALKFHLEFHKNIFEAILDPISESELESFELTMLKILGGIKEINREFEPIKLSQSEENQEYIISEVSPDISALHQHDSIKIVSITPIEVTLLLHEIKMTLPMGVCDSILVLKRFQKELKCST
ncbi:MAG: MarR family transcriptional regulator [Fusobacteria bacterium]|nr:MarR family transcriptional regulator [Fusobacteriota bacterium]